jgi:hypothetical protein
VLEDFIEAVFAGTLDAVAEEGGGPTKEYAADAFLCIYGLPACDVGCVDFGIDLAASFDEILRCG